LEKDRDKKLAEEEDSGLPESNINMKKRQKNWNGKVHGDYGQKEKPIFRTKSGNKKGSLAIVSDDDLTDDAWEEFMLGIDPAWHEYKGPIKQDD
jgi:hypothetical protein